MALLGKKYFTKGKIMITVTAESVQRPLQPFDPKIDKVDFMELVRKCEGIKAEQANSLYKELCKVFLGNPAIAWTTLPDFVDLAPTKKFKVEQTVCS